MTITFEEIYTHHAHDYDQLVGREDQRGNLFAAIDEICPFAGLTVVDLGAGTGRVTRMMAVLAEKVIALDASAHMLATAHDMLDESGLDNWRLAVGLNEQLPLAERVADVVIEGWSFGHIMGWYGDDWQTIMDVTLAEAQRILKPNGTLILIETLGTGSKQPQPPTERLAMLYEYCQNTHGFEHRWVRTDYQFESIAEAEHLTRFFFGDELADRVVRERLTILPECTGNWWRRNV